MLSRKEARDPGGVHAGRGDRDATSPANARTERARVSRSTSMSSRSARARISTAPRISSGNPNVQIAPSTTVSNDASIASRMRTGGGTSARCTAPTNAWHAFHAGRQGRGRQRRHADDIRRPHRTDLRPTTTTTGRPMSPCSQAGADNAESGRTLENVNGTQAHRHGLWSHEHHHHGPHRHPRLPFRSTEAADHHHADHTPRRPSPTHGEHGHTHGRIDRSIIRSRAGVRAVSLSLAILGVTAALQAVVFVLSGSVALLADLIHNAGDALTAIPLAIAFLARSERGERWAGLRGGVRDLRVGIGRRGRSRRTPHPPATARLPRRARRRRCRRLRRQRARRKGPPAGGSRGSNSAALVADGHHARVDGFVSLGVVASAAVSTIGFPRADPLIGLAITALILRITWQAWQDRSRRRPLPSPSAAPTCA